MCWQFLQTRSNVFWQLHSRDLRLASESSEKAICTCLKLKKSFVLKLTYTDSDQKNVTGFRKPAFVLSGPTVFKVVFCGFFRMWFWICYFPLESGKSFCDDMFYTRIIFSHFYSDSTPPLPPALWHLSFIKASLVPPLLQSLVAPMQLQLCCLSLISSEFSLREKTQHYLTYGKKCTIINTRTLRTCSSDLFLFPFSSVNCLRQELVLS